MSLELLFLGTGTSAGIPMIGCECAVCRSQDPRDRRTRTSMLVRYPRLRPRKVGSAGESDDQSRPVQILIDTAPELRLQALGAGLNYLDGVLFTHDHADHIFGMDDLRRFNAIMQRALDIYADGATLERFRDIFRYIFAPEHNANDSFIPTLTAHRVEPGVSLELWGARWTPLALLHGRQPVLGYRVDHEGRSAAYCTDCSAIPPQTYPLLKNLDVLVIDGLRYRHHPTHLTVDQALYEIEQIKPKRAYLTHIAHDILHADLAAKLPEKVFLPHDGLSVRVE